MFALLFSKEPNPLVYVLGSSSTLDGVSFLLSHIVHYIFVQIEFTDLSPFLCKGIGGCTQVQKQMRFLCY